MKTVPKVKFLFINTKKQKNPQNMWNSVLNRIRGTWFLLFEFFTILSGTINFCKKMIYGQKVWFWNSV